MKKNIMCLFFVSLLVSGCANNPFTISDPYTREDKVSKTTIGAGTCGAAGALIGGLVGDWPGALIGGASGAALCGGIGYYLDSHEAQLRKRLEATGVRVVREGNSIRLVMPGNILFATDVDRVNPSFYPVLDSIGTVLQEYDNSGVLIQGHTDNRGPASYNLELSKRRATSVDNYLVYQGVAGQRLLVLGFGETQPIANNATAQGRSMNRRVELVITPRQQ